MIYLESILLACLCTLGGVCSYTDIRTHRIPNKAIAVAFGIGTAIHLISIIIYGFTYYDAWFLEMFIAVVLAFILYFIQIWAPGDVKLFAACYYLIPPRLLDSFSLQHAVTPFLFTFSIAFLYVLFDTCIRLCRHEKWKASLLPDIRTLLVGFLQTIIISSGTFYLILLLFQGQQSQNGLFISFSVLLYVLSASGKPFFRKWQILVLHLIPVLIYWFTQGFVFPLPDWRVLLILISTLIIKRLASGYNYQCIPTMSVQPGMVLSADTVSLFFSSKIQGLPLDVSENLSARITDDHVEAIKLWGKTSKGKSEIWIIRKIPFGIMIFAGFAAWILIRLWR